MDYSKMMKKEEEEEDFRDEEELEEEMMMMMMLSLLITLNDKEQEAGLILLVPLLSGSLKVQWNLHRLDIIVKYHIGTYCLVALVDHADPDDPSPHPTRRPRHDDPYVMVRDLVAREEGDDAATTSDPQPSQPPGSPHYHL
ncbi:hypothetical protein Tco_1238843 [Tanacetum coccineum]